MGILEEINASYDPAKRAQQVEKQLRQQKAEQQASADEASRRAVQVQQDEATRLNFEYNEQNQGRMNDAQWRRWVTEHYGFCP